MLYMVARRIKSKNLKTVESDSLVKQKVEENL